MKASFASVRLAWLTSAQNGLGSMPKMELVPTLRTPEVELMDLLMRFPPLFTGASTDYETRIPLREEDYKDEEARCITMQLASTKTCFRLNHVC